MGYFETRCLRPGYTAQPIPDSRHRTKQGKQNPFLNSKHEWLNNFLNEKTKKSAVFNQLAQKLIRSLYLLNA